MVVCVSCAFVGCVLNGHFRAHIEMHPKHFVGLQLVSKTFWCEPCRMDIPIDVRPKVETARQEFWDAVEEIAAKKRRQLRHLRRGVQTSMSPITTPVGSTTNVLLSHILVDARGEELMPETKGEELLMDGEVRGRSEDEQERIGAAVLGMPLPTKAREDKTQRQVLKTAVRTREAGRDVTILTSSLDAANSSELPITVQGFTNLGNTCYFNASVQALLTVTHYFPEHMHIDEVLETMDTPITTTFTYV